MGIVSCLGGVPAREWHASFCAYDNVCKIFTLFLKIQSCEGQNVRHIRRKYEKGRKFNNPALEEEHTIVEQIEDKLFSAVAFEFWEVAFMDCGSVLFLRDFLMG